MKDMTDGRPRPATHSGEGAAGRTVFAPGSRINGQVKADALVLEGFFEGEVHARSVRLEASGEANATLPCDAAEILGRFDGTIEARVLRFGPAAVAQGVFKGGPYRHAIVSGSFNVDGADRTSAAPHVIVIRDGATQADHADTDPLHLDHVAQQRQLNDKGSAQAKAVADAFRASAIKIGKATRAGSTAPWKPGVLSAARNPRRRTT